MTIQEVERQSGMTRANIRFYEEKGLLTPQRQPNGYRDYSAADVETLRRVRAAAVAGYIDRYHPRAAIGRAHAGSCAG